MSLVTTVLLLTLKLPVIETEPVNWWVLVSIVPNLVEPVTKSVEEVITWAIIVWAIRVPVINAFEAVTFCLIKKLSAELAVKACEAVIAFIATDVLTANDAVVAKEDVRE